MELSTCYEPVTWRRIYEGTGRSSRPHHRRGRDLLVDGEVGAQAGGPSQPGLSERIVSQYEQHVREAPDSLLPQLIERTGLRIEAAGEQRRCAAIVRQQVAFGTSRQRLATTLRCGR